ncbi:Pyruvate kinase [compost metagenome]
MLESMQVNPRPTRAEVSDVSNAVLQGADVVMLSGESAAGKYPVQAVTTMAAVARKAEEMMDYKSQFNKKRKQHIADITEVISQGTVSTALELGAKAIVAATESGFTARMISKYRPNMPIIAITHHDHVLAKLSLLFGVIPVKGEAWASTDAMFESAKQTALKTGYAKEGDTLIVSAGIPLGQAGNTNLIKVIQA